MDVEYCRRVHLHVITLCHYPMKFSVMVTCLIRNDVLDRITILETSKIADFFASENFRIKLFLSGHDGEREEVKDVVTNGYISLKPQ